MPLLRFLTASSLRRRAAGFSSTAAMDDGKAAGGVAERIMPHLLNMYGSRATARDFEIYAPNATFEDPLMRAHGVQQIKSSFYALPKILIDNKQHYKVFGKSVELTTLIRLQVEDGKVVSHQDWWDKKPLMNRDTVAGRMAEATRRGAMLLTHALMRFGKDPPPPSS
ncbi:unnamed protein product [Urochloa decumbens]|uniref:Uncharacterized protein n=1 Tax=Urochloa decumbens TaxID=240449 RepID=A0ABC9A8G9_9POAL